MFRNYGDEIVGKGVSGSILTTIISLVLAIIALALLWIFLTGAKEIVFQSVERIMAGIKCSMFCKGLLGFLGNLGGMCSGC
ncbi:MAG: hypothetical protein GW865_03035 [Candidatus Aenigmarchaeota archaeon]|nr:hypothetical protein [Candidatus Aenigmarchaeota archaeon]